MDLDGASNSTLLQQLPRALQLHVLSFLPPNDRALSGRLVSPDAAKDLSSSDHCTAFLCQPLPPNAAPWPVEAGQQHMRQLPFWHKLQLLSIAAASGSEVNLEVALALLQPSIFPELLQCWELYNVPDPDVAAVKAGHPQLLGWMLRRCPGLVISSRVLQAVARYGDLAGLQTTWEMLQTRSYHRRRVALAVAQRVLDAAAGGSGSGDAVAKMEWVLKAGRGRCSLQQSTAEAAARSGDLGRLRWLRDRGCTVGGIQVLRCALRHADLAVAQWLVDEAGCELPAVGSSAGRWLEFLRAAAGSCDAVAKWQWLQERGAPRLDTHGTWVFDLSLEAIKTGQLGAVRHLLSSFGPDAVLQPPANVDPGLLELQAARSRCIPLMELLHQSGLVLTHRSYIGAAHAGDLAMVLWLAREAGVSAAGLQLQHCVESWGSKTEGGGFASHSSSRDLLEAVQLLVGEAGWSGWDADDDEEDADFRFHRNPLCGAAARGDLALVQYLLQQRPGYLVDGRALVAAAWGGCEALLEWLVEQHPGCLAGPWGEPAYMAPAISRQLGTLAALRRLGVPWGAEDVVVQAVEQRCAVPVLWWLVEQGAPVGSQAAMEAAVAGTRHRLSAEGGAWLRGVAAGRRGGQRGLSVGPSYKGGGGTQCVTAAATGHA